PPPPYTPPFPYTTLFRSNDSFITTISVGSQNDGLNSQLHALGRPRLISILGRNWPSMLVIDRHRLSVRELRKIELCDDLVLLGRERNRSRNHRLFRHARWGRRLSAFLVDAAVLDAAFDRIRAFDKDSLHLFVIEETRTIDELVDHPRRQIIRPSA